MADEHDRQNSSQRPDAQSKGVSGDGITHPQEQQTFLDRPPKSLVDWLVQVHLRLLALEQERNDDTS